MTMTCMFPTYVCNNTDTPSDEEITKQCPSGIVSIHAPVVIWGYWSYDEYFLLYISAP